MALHVSEPETYSRKGSYKVDPENPHWLWSIEITEAELARLEKSDLDLLWGIFHQLAKTQDVRVFDTWDRKRFVCGSGSLNLPRRSEQVGAPTSS